MGYIRTVSVVALVFLSGCNQYKKLIGQDDRSLDTVHTSLHSAEFAKKLWAEFGWTQHELSDEEVCQVVKWTVNVLLQDDSSVDAWRDKWFNVLPPYFQGFMHTDTFGSNKYGAFCQKSALSSAEVLFAMGIWTRQVHMTNKTTKIGDHQFFEFYSNRTGKWRVIDPFYGVYFEENGQAMRALRLRDLGAQGADVRQYMVSFHPERVQQHGTVSPESLAWRWNNEHLSDGVNYPAWIKESWNIWMYD